MSDYLLDIETISLESIVGRVLCIVIHEIDSGKVLTFKGENEKQLLTDFWNSIDNFSNIITFNGDFFDIPFLVLRSIVNSVKVKKINSIDLRKIVNSYYLHEDEYRKGSLRTWATILGMRVETHDSSQMSGLYAIGDWDSIEKHCHEDVSICLLLWNRVKECGLI